MGQLSSLRKTPKPLPCEHMKIADTHTHLYFESFDRDREKVLEENRKAGVGLQIQIGCDEISSLVALDLAKKHEDMYCTIGLHPVDVWDFMHQAQPRRYAGYENYVPRATTLDAFAEWMEALYLKNKDFIVGFGETGIDLYHHNTPELLEQQLYSFKKHLDLCKKYNKTLVIHSRGASEQTLDFMRKNIQKGEIQGIWHCFCEDTEMAQIIVEEFDFYLGFGGVLTYPNAQKVREALRGVPIDRILTETDAPFLVPQSLKKNNKRNESKFLQEVVKVIAEEKKRPLEEISEALFDNAKKVYHLD